MRRSVQTQTESTREQSIVESNLGLVHFVARQVSRGVGSDIELDELVSAGTLGLIGAAESFDATRGLAFSTYAAPRIRGAILDELRKIDHATRGQRRRSRDIEKARSAESTARGRRAKPAEIAGRLGIDVDTLWRWEADSESAVQVAIDSPLRSDDGDALTPLDLIAGDDGTAIEEEMTLAGEVAVLRDSILELKEQERTVLSLYFFEEMTLNEIAQVLGVTESRVSQIRTKALARLRERMSPLRAKVA
jgi:RNA polymerase sigma factor for flagellar operon FliA